MAKAAPANPSPHVAEGYRLRAERDLLMARREAILKRFDAKIESIDAQLTELEKQLIAVGPGRYTDGENQFASVIPEVPKMMGPDTFDLRSKEDEDRARELAGEDFGKLFDRHVYFTPKEDFRGRCLGALTTAKAGKLITLCLIPGQETGGRRAHVRWK